MATDRLARLLADLEAQGIDAARLLDLAGLAEHFHAMPTEGTIAPILRALADAAAEPARPKRCPTCGSADPARVGVQLEPAPQGVGWVGVCSDPFHDGASR